MSSLTLIIPFAAFVQAPDSTLLAQSLNDLRAHPVEIVAKDTEATVVRAHALLDIDRDGRPEIFIAIAPKYRQTATIVIYKMVDDNRVQRLYEGLAPGKLVPVSNRQIDTHTLGNGIDMTIEGGADSSMGVRLLATARTQGMQIVRYPNFFHVDERSQAAQYVDIASASPGFHETTCESFEFSPVEALASGRVGSDTVGRYLAALTPAEVVFYRLRGISSDGRLQKTSWSVPRPDGLVKLQVTIDGLIVGVSSDGRRVPLTLPQ